MTRKDRKRYSREFKLEAVKRSYESGKPVTEVARELDLSKEQGVEWNGEVQVYTLYKTNDKEEPKCQPPF